MDLVIAVPHYEKWEPEFGHSLAMAMSFLSKPGRLSSLRLVRCEATNIAEGRNALSEDALENGGSHMLWLDSDMVFRADDIDKLISHDVDFVAANYLKRNPPHESTANWIKGAESGLCLAEHVGFGFVLMKTEILKKIPKPWFCFFPKPDSNDQITEDIWFCRTARSAGVDLYVDLDLNVGHVSKRILRWR